MTKNELNRDIKRLAKYINGIAAAAEMMQDNTAYYRDIDKVARPEFIRLYYAADNFSYLTHKSVLIMVRLNLAHRFIAFHQFGNKNRY